MHLKDDIAELIDCSVRIRGYLWTVNVVAFVFFEVLPWWQWCLESNDELNDPNGVAAIRYAITIITCWVDEFPADIVDA